MSKVLKVAISTACCGGSWSLTNWVWERITKRRKHYPFELGLELQPRRSHNYRCLFSLAAPVFSFHAPFWNDLNILEPRILAENLLWWSLQGGPGDNQILGFGHLGLPLVFHDNTIRMLLEAGYIRGGDNLQIAVENNLAKLVESLSVATKLGEKIDKVTVCFDLAHEAKTELIGPGCHPEYSATYIQNRLIPDLREIKKSGRELSVVHLHNVVSDTSGLHDHRPLSQGLLPMDAAIKTLLEPQWGVSQFTVEVTSPFGYIARMIGFGASHAARAVMSDLDFIARAVG